MCAVNYVAAFIALCTLCTFAAGHEPNAKPLAAKQQLARQYNDLYAKECAGTYDKLKSLADQCTAELGMVSECPKINGFVSFPRVKPLSV